MYRGGGNKKKTQTIGGNFIFVGEGSQTTKKNHDFNVEKSKPLETKAGQYSLDEWDS